MRLRKKIKLNCKRISLFDRCKEQTLKKKRITGRRFKNTQNIKLGGQCPKIHRYIVIGKLKRGKSA